MTNLSSMNPQKRELLIQAALEEFGSFGFQKASTNHIAEKSGVSKGLIFHYFRSKKGLYDYLVDFVYRLVGDWVVHEIDWEEGDLIARLLQITLAKLSVMKQYPGMIAFSKRVTEHLDFEQVKDLMEEKLPDLYFQVYHKNVDFSLFKDELDPQKSAVIIQMAIERLGENFLEQLKKSQAELDVDQFAAQIADYLGVIRKAFYKEAWA